MYSKMNPVFRTALHLILLLDKFTRNYQNVFKHIETTTKGTFSCSYVTGIIIKQPQKSLGLAHHNGLFNCYLR